MKKTKLHVPQGAVEEAERRRGEAADQWWRENGLNVLRSGYNEEQIAREAFIAGWTASSEDFFKRVAQKIKDSSVQRLVNMARSHKDRKVQS